MNLVDYLSQVSLLAFNRIYRDQGMVQIIVTVRSDAVVCRRRIEVARMR